MKTLRVYSRPGCHLCDELVRALAPIVRGRARLEVVDVETDPALEKRYGLRIPVLVGGGREVSVHPLDTPAVEAYLASEHG